NQLQQHLEGWASRVAHRKASRFGQSAQRHYREVWLSCRSEVREQPMLIIRPEVQTALDQLRPVVALESSLIAHGLPWPANVETALAAEEAVRAADGVPATIAILNGQPVIGL